MRFAAVGSLFGFCSIYALYLLLDVVLCHSLLFSIQFPNPSSEPASQPTPTRNHLPAAAAAAVCLPGYSSAAAAVVHRRMGQFSPNSSSISLPPPPISCCCWMAVNSRVHLLSGRTDGQEYNNTSSTGSGVQNGAVSFRTRSLQ
jgi:hypothetical protein